MDNNENMSSKDMENKKLILIPKIFTCINSPNKFYVESLKKCLTNNCF